MIIIDFLLTCRSSHAACSSADSSMLASFGRFCCLARLSTASGESQLHYKLSGEHCSKGKTDGARADSLAFASAAALRRIFSLPYCQTYVQIFLSQGLACGLAPGVAFLPALSCISHWFKRRRGAALGVFATGASIGGLVYPILLNKLLYNPQVGFPWAIRAGASSFKLRRRTSTRPCLHRTELAPARISLSLSRRLTYALSLTAGFLTLGMLLIACATLRARLPPRKGGVFFDLKVFKDPAYAFITLGASVVMLGLYTPMVYAQEYAEQEKLGSTARLYCLSILSAASVFGRLIPNVRLTFRTAHRLLTKLLFSTWRTSMAP